MSQYITKHYLLFNLLALTEAVRRRTGHNESSDNVVSLGNFSTSPLVMNTLNSSVPGLPTRFCIANISSSNVISGNDTISSGNSHSIAPVTQTASPSCVQLSEVFNSLISSTSGPNSNNILIGNGSIPIIAAPVSLGAGTSSTDASHQIDYVTAPSTCIFKMAATPVSQSQLHLGSNLQPQKSSPSPPIPPVSTSTNQTINNHVEPFSPEQSQQHNKQQQQVPSRSLVISAPLVTTGQALSLASLKHGH
ncbi:unnamed protein product [Protopolystoma xenopodis]|uniref:Uncharacterized protein n=1 Tax=Protopolystoma xenopodis TaxID=117903 RepID=A0A448XP83_9PLAT|nr:unnamed protein product [Protopolystoma xenopodis]